MVTHIKCMIIDDDELDRLVLQHYIRQYENIEIAATFDTAEKAVPYLDIPVDLLITETNLRGMNGLEFRKLAHKIPACIFVSSHPELAAGANRQAYHNTINSRNTRKTVTGLLNTATQEEIKKQLPKTNDFQKLVTSKS